jgi:hypothetical protein
MQRLIPKHTFRHRNATIARYFFFRLMAVILNYRGQWQSNLIADIKMHNVTKERFPDGDIKRCRFPHGPSMIDPCGQSH